MIMVMMMHSSWQRVKVRRKDRTNIFYSELFYDKWRIIFIYILIYSIFKRSINKIKPVVLFIDLVEYHRKMYNEWTGINFCKI